MYTYLKPTHPQTFKQRTATSRTTASLLRPSIDILPTAKVHFINGTPPCFKKPQILYCLSDIPKIKDSSNRLNFTIAECDNGLLMFEERAHLLVLKDYLKLDYYVTGLTDDQLNSYRVKLNGTCSDVVIVYNSYSDLKTRSSYFLYYTI